MDVPASRVKDEVCEEIIGMTSVSHDITASPASPAESYSLRTLTDQKKKSNLNSPRRKSRVKSSSRRLFLDNGLSDEEKVDDRTAINAFGDKNLIGHKYEWAENEGNDCMDAEQDCSLIPLSTTYENSWTCPLTFDELSPSPCDPETKDYSRVQPVSQSPGPAESAVRSNNCSGMILKLRRMFSEGLNRRKDCYQAISDSRTFADLSLSQINDGEGEVSSNMDIHRRLPEITQRWQRTEGFSRALRPHSSSSKKKCRSLLKIKYCPYLSACHSADRKRRWVLRSAVRRAQRAMRFYYPDLVGKRIRHLYEEDDKSEVWYRGEVLRVHEANTNPLKTIFEVRYDSEPEWKYYLELLIDYKKGWLKIED